jgi:predicted nucleotidyltransferase
MMSMDGHDGVMPVAEARAGLSSLLREFRAKGASAAPVVIGSHRKPEAALIPYAALASLQAAADAVAGRSGEHAAPVLDELRRRKPLIERLARANRIRSVEVFGSVARGEEGAESDVDLLVVPESDASLFDLAQFELDMESLLERRVDVVSRRSLDPLRDREVLEQATAL